MATELYADDKLVATVDKTKLSGITIFATSSMIFTPRKTRITAILPHNLCREGMAMPRIRLADKLSRFKNSLETRTIFKSKPSRFGIP